MFESINQLEKLMKDPFKGTAYEAAGALIPTQPTYASSN